MPLVERALQVLVFGKTSQRDRERAPELFATVSAVHDVSKDTAGCSLVDVIGVLTREKRDHRTGGVSDDFRDQLEGVLRTRAEPDERNIGMLASRNTA